MKSTNTFKVVAVTLALILASSALSSTAMAQNGDETSRDSSRTAEELARHADKMAEKAEELLARAEEQGNDAAIEEVEAALRYIEEAKSLIEEDEFEEAKSALREARDHLASAHRHLGGHGPSSGPHGGSGNGHSGSGDGESAEGLLKRAEHMMDRAERLQSLAHEQENERALEVLDEAIGLIRKAVAEVEDGNIEEAKEMLIEANRMLNTAQRMLSASGHGPDGHRPDNPQQMKERVIEMAEHMMEGARHLASVAEENGNEEALETIHKAVDLLEEAVRIASADDGDVREAYQLLKEAAQTLKRVAEELSVLGVAPHGPGSVGPKHEDRPETLSEVAEYLAAKAQRIQSAAEEQENREAYAEAETALELIAEAEKLIEDGNDDDSKAKLREAMDHLRNAVRMLQPAQVISTENSARFIGDRAEVAERANDIFEIRFGLEGSGYAVLKSRNGDGAGSLYSTEISMHGVALEESRSAFNFVVNDVVITARSVAPQTTASDSFIELTSVDAWDLKARRGGHLFVTDGTVEDPDGNTYRVKLRGLLLDASSDGLVFKVDGRIHHTGEALTDQNNPYLFANLHYLAVAKAAE